MASLLVGLLPVGSGLAPPAPQGGAVACAGIGGAITFDPPLTAALGFGTVHASFAWECACAPDLCDPIPPFEGTYQGDCAEAIIEAPNWAPGSLNVWGGRLVQATAVLALVPNFMVAADFAALLAPGDPCNQSLTAILATQLVFSGACRPEPGSDGCG